MTFPGARASRKEVMNHESIGKIKLLVKEVLFNTKTQTEWLNNADPDILSALGAFARRLIAGDENTSKVDAFRMGVIMGGVYEHMKGVKERGEKK